jgi:hypothetical protein
MASCNASKKSVRFIADELAKVTLETPVQEPTVVSEAPVEEAFVDANAPVEVADVVSDAPIVVTAVTEEKPAEQAEASAEVEAVVAAERQPEVVLEVVPAEVTATECPNVSDVVVNDNLEVPADKNEDAEQVAEAPLEPTTAE